MGHDHELKQSRVVISGVGYLCVIHPDSPDPRNPDKGVALTSSSLILFPYDPSL
jgi:hypothetical protein